MFLKPCALSNIKIVNSKDSSELIILFCSKPLLIISIVNLVASATSCWFWINLPRQPHGIQAILDYPNLCTNVSELVWRAQLPLVTFVYYRRCLILKCTLFESNEIPWIYLCLLFSKRSMMVPPKKLLLDSKGCMFGPNGIS